MCLKSHNFLVVYEHITFKGFLMYLTNGNRPHNSGKKLGQYEHETHHHSLINDTLDLRKEISECDLGNHQPLCPSL